MSKTGNLYLIWALIGTGMWWTDGQTNKQNYCS